ncbi:hypothetical protein PARU111607_08470 [Palleronia rufa]
MYMTSPRRADRCASRHQSPSRNQCDRDNSAQRAPLPGRVDRIEPALTAGCELCTVRAERGAGPFARSGPPAGRPAAGAPASERGAPEGCLDTPPISRGRYSRPCPPRSCGRRGLPSCGILAGRRRRATPRSRRSWIAAEPGQADPAVDQGLVDIGRIDHWGHCFLFAVETALDEEGSKQRGPDPQMDVGRRWGAASLVEPTLRRLPPRLADRGITALDRLCAGRLLGSRISA